jgi:hypothetical protein
VDFDRTVRAMQRFTIVNKARTEVSFRFNASQKMALQILRRQYEKDGMIRAIMLKARRVGMSTLTEGLLNVHCFATPNAKAMILAHLFDSSLELFGIAKRMRDSVGNGHVWMPPGTQKSMYYPGTRSNLSVRTAGSKGGGRSMALSAIHFSEAAHYPETAESFTSILPALPHKPGTICIIESTANGKSGDGETFYKYWLGAMQGTNAFVPIFIPWTMDPECVRDPEEAEDAPIDEEEADLLGMGVTKAQLAWRRMTLETESQGLIDKFHQEYPISWQQAFISSGNPAFNPKELEYAGRFVTPPLADKFLPRAKLEFSRAADNHKEILFTPNESGVTVWESPKKGHHYYLGADVARAESDRSDYSAFTLINGTTGDWAARYFGRVDPFKLADMVDMVGRTYNNAMVIMEVNSMGAYSQKQLRDIYHYPKIYRWKGGRDDSAPGKRMNPALGWVTTGDSRRMMFASFRAGLRYEKFQIFDPVLFAQCDAATYDDAGRWELEVGHDDVLVSAMLAWVACEQYPPPRHIGSKTLSLELEEYDEDESFDPMKQTEFMLAQAPVGHQPDVNERMRRHYEWVRREKKSTDRLAGI